MSHIKSRQIAEKVDVGNKERCWMCGRMFRRVGPSVHWCAKCYKRISLTDTKDL